MPSPPPLQRGCAGSTAAGGHTTRGGERGLPPCARPPPTPFAGAGRRRGGPPIWGFSDAAGPRQVWRVCACVREACESGAPRGQPAPGPAFFWFVLLFLFFPFCFLRDCL